jgi:hypothetical protein
MRRFVAGCALLASLAASASVGVQVEKATQGERCVADTATMRRDHMRMLRHQRDDTVRAGIRGTQFSLKGCIDCHASVKTGSVAAAPSDFCVACHAYAAVTIDCFECHASRPAAKAASR